MSTTISMWLGIAFTLLGIAAVIIQAWLWSFPMLPDPGGPDPHGRSSAPRAWTMLHRVIGILYAVIYVVLMIEMVPRLWAYQVELPARTVVHACMGITIGVLLITKVAIIRWFQHFGQALPSIGMGLLLCTLILATLSIPYALQAHDFGDALEAKNLARVERVLKSVKWEEEGVDVSVLATEAVLKQGRKVLTAKCVVCHDMRTILKKPRNADSWYRVTKRMQEKPAINRRIVDSDVGPVTAYLVAITPNLQESRSRKKTADAAVAAKKVAANKAMDHSKPADANPPAYDEAAAKKVYETKCSECHELDDVDAVGNKDRAGWEAIMKDMIDNNDAELTKEETTIIVEYLVRTKGK